MIEFRIGAWVFKPRLLPTILTLLMLPVLLGLGTWQVHRLHWKHQLIATIDARIHEAPADLPLPENSDPDYRPAKADGVFMNDVHFYMLATEVVSGKGGYHVITPLRMSDGHILLIDRGWIAYLSRPEEDFYMPGGKVTVQGYLKAPKSPGWLTPANDPVKNNWYSYDVPAMAKAGKLDNVLPYVLEAASADAHTGNNDDLPVGNQTRLKLPNDHLQYAITWYGLAMALVVIYFVSSFRRNGAGRPKAK